MFGKLKQMMGIGGVKLHCKSDTPYIFYPSSPLMGVVEITSKSDQFVSSLTVKIMEKRTTGSGENRKTEEFELANQEIGSDISVTAGETQSIDFALFYTVDKTMSDRLSDRSGVMGALGSVAKFANSQSTTFELHAHAKVKGTAFGSGHTLPLTYKSLA